MVDGDTRRDRGGQGLPTDWDQPYAGTPPWDIGRPQAPFVDLASAGALRGRLLDVGCGTGEHALLAAEHDATATGVDLAPTAVARARAKADERGLLARFLVHDALRVDELGERFDVVLDCGFLHVLDDRDRAVWIEVLRRILTVGGTYHLLCFSDRVPGDAGPRRIRRDDITAAFADGFVVEQVAASAIEATFLDQPVPAWLARIVRT